MEYLVRTLAAISDNRNFFRTLIFLVTISFPPFLRTELKSQDLGDSLSLKAEVYQGVQWSSQDDFLPHYLVSNGFGEIDERDVFFMGGRFNYDLRFTPRLSLHTGVSFRNEIFSSYYMNLIYNKIELKIGRNPNQVGGLKNDLSSGSMGISRNALPVPGISVGISEFQEVPFTKGYFKFKGFLSHGWLEENRVMSNALLHSKAFYLKLDLEKEIGWTAASGVVHFAQYGGTSPQGELQPSSFSDYLRVFRGAGIPNPDGTTEGESNGLGNHLGIIETTVTKQLGKHKLTVNYQKPFEDEGGIQYVSLTDYLFGLEWTLPEEGKWLSKVYLEYIQTKWQGGPGIPDPNESSGIISEDDNFGYPFGGRDDLYNNWLYRSGWTYQGQTIGNPLFLTHQRTLNFFAPYPDYGVSIANNRIRAVHLGLEGKLSKMIQYRGLFTYSTNFGTYTGLYQGRFEWAGVATNPEFDYGFRPGQKQLYSMVEFTGKDLIKGKPIDLKVVVSMDRGDLYRVFGTQIVVSYMLTKH